jgi:hypothetical protein
MANASNNFFVTKQDEFISLRDISDADHFWNRVDVFFRKISKEEVVKLEEFYRVKEEI